MTDKITSSEARAVRARPDQLCDDLIFLDRIKNRMDNKEVKELLERVERIAQCPVCLEIVSPPVVLCVNGHITCSQCRNGARICHVCRRPFSETSARVFEELLSTMPKPCPNEECEAVTILETHPQYCVYRHIRCRLGEDLECGWSGTVKQWLRHVSQQHSKTTYQFTVIECLHFSDFLGDWTARCYYHQVEGDHFLSHVWKSGNKFYHIFRHVECEKPKDKYFFLISYKCGPRVLYKSLIEALPLKDNESMQNNPAVFFLEELNSMVDGNGKLSVFVEALKKPIN